MDPYVEVTTPVYDSLVPEYIGEVFPTCEGCYVERSEPYEL